MFSLDNQLNDEIELTDGTIENSWIVARFLDLLYSYSLSEPTHELEVLLYPALIAFLQKYEAETALQAMRVTMQLWASRTKLSGKAYFQVGIALRDAEVMAAAIRRTGHRMTEDPTGQVSVLEMSNTASRPPKLTLVNSPPIRQRPDPSTSKTSP